MTPFAPPTIDERTETHLMDISTVLLDALNQWTAGTTPTKENYTIDIPGFTFSLGVRLGLLPEPEPLPEESSVPIGCFSLGYYRVTKEYRDRFTALLDLEDAHEDTRIVDEFVRQLRLAEARGIALEWRDDNPIKSIEDYCALATKIKGRSIGRKIARTGRFVNIIAAQDLKEQPDPTIKNEVDRLTTKSWLTKKVNFPQQSQIDRAHYFLRKMSAYCPEACAQLKLTWENLCWMPKRVD